MSVVLALAGALLYGLGDFCGGLASRRAATLAVVAASQLASVVVLVPALLLIPARFDWPSVVWGAAAGVVGVTGLLLFYRGLALGAMTVVAPLTALASAAVPVLAGVLLGDRPSAVAFAGVGLALVGVVLISAQGGRLPGPRLLASAATLTALGAGLAFGLLFVLLSRADADTGMWPLAGARTASLLVLAALAVVRRASVVPRGAPPALAMSHCSIRSGSASGWNCVASATKREGLVREPRGGRRPDRTVRDRTRRRASAAPVPPRRSEHVAARGAVQLERRVPDLDPPGRFDVCAERRGDQLSPVSSYRDSSGS